MEETKLENFTKSEELQLDKRKGQNNLWKIRNLFPFRVSQTLKRKLVLVLQTVPMGMDKLWNRIRSSARKELHRDLIT